MPSRSATRVRIARAGGEMPLPASAARSCSSMKARSRSWRSPQASRSRSTPASASYSADLPARKQSIARRDVGAA